LAQRWAALFGIRTWITALFGISSIS